jgi:carbon-monoxide dehydrogenase iron sulfur subunit
VAPGLEPTTAFPNRCRHCDPAPCQQVCPTGAITRDDVLGVVLVDPDAPCVRSCAPST